MLGRPAEETAPLQVAAPGLIGFAAMNWVGRGSLYGGIYGRPIVVGNFACAAVLTTVLVSLLLDASSPGGWMLVVASLACWAAFGRLPVRPPFDVSPPGGRRQARER